MLVNKKYLLILAIVVPLSSLTVLVFQKNKHMNSGIEVRIPIDGNDPRDLLAGYYLRYRVLYGVEELCPISPKMNKYPAYICLETKKFSATKFKNCLQMIKGICSNRIFNAGIEHYYVPEDQAKKLEQLILKSPMSIVVKLNSQGEAQLIDLLVDGVSWRDHSDQFMNPKNQHSK
jgi:uncharacterized membrane-anchored protein